jgi:hypothetical protein
MLLHNLLSRFKKEAHHWTTHSILETYADPYCHHVHAFLAHLIDSVATLDFMSYGVAFLLSSYATCVSTGLITAS